MKNKITHLPWLIILLPFFVLGQQKMPYEKITLPLETVDGRPVFSMMINGKGPYHFLFDTGKMGSEININKDIENDFQFDVIDSLILGDPTGKNNMLLPIVYIPSVSVGSVSIVNVRAVVDAHLPGNVSGVVGLLFFKDFLLTLDLLQNQLILRKPNQVLAFDSNTVHYKSMMGIPVLNIQVGSHKIEAQLDCGNSKATIVIPESLAKNLTFIGKPSDMGIGNSMFNEVEMKEVKIKESLHIGPYKIDQPLISFPSFWQFCQPGKYFLRHFRISFDQKKQLIKLIKTSDGL